MFPHAEIHARLLAFYGPQPWWSAESPFEALVGAMLAQNTSRKNVERAIANLRAADALDPDALHRLDLEELAELIRPAGNFRPKSRRLANLLDYLFERHGGSLGAMFATDLPTLRSELLQINGVGPETADSILLHAGHLPTFVVDTHAHRVLARHGWIGFEAGYHEIKELIEPSLEPDPAHFNEFHSLLVLVGNEFCRKTPRCEGCPLAQLLPENRVQELW